MSWASGLACSKPAGTVQYRQVKQHSTVQRSTAQLKDEVSEGIRGKEGM